MSTQTETKKPAASERHERGVVLSVSLLATGLLVSVAGGSIDPMTAVPTLVSGLTLILSGAITWTVAARIYVKSKGTSNGA